MAKGAIVRRLLALLLQRSRSPFQNALANNKSPTRCKCVCGRGAQSGTPPNAKGRSPRVTAPSTSAAGGTGGVHSPATPKTGGRGGVDQASAPNASASTADGDGVGRIDGVAIPSTTPGFIPKVCFVTSCSGVSGWKFSLCWWACDDNCSRSRFNLRRIQSSFGDLSAFMHEIRKTTPL